VPLTAVDLFTVTRNDKRQGSERSPELSHVDRLELTNRVPHDSSTAVSVERSPPRFALTTMFTGYRQGSSSPKILGEGGIAPSALRHRVHFFPFSETGKNTNYRPIFEICH